METELENGGHLGSMISMRCWKFDVKKNLVRIRVVYYANKDSAPVGQDSVSLPSPLDVVLLSGARHGKFDQDLWNSPLMTEICGVSSIMRSICRHFVPISCCCKRITCGADVAPLRISGTF